MRRLVIILVAITALVVAGAAIGAIIAKPLLEDRLADAIGAELGTPVTVDMDLNRVPGGLVGRVGDVHVTAPELQRDGVKLVNLDVTLDEADVALTQLVRGKAKVSWNSIALQVGMTEAALRDYLAKRLAAAGVPNTDQLVVNVTPKAITAAIPGLGAVTIAVRVIGPEKIQLDVQGSGQVAAAVRKAVAKPIDVGPLPLGLSLRQVVQGRGIVYVQGDSDAGSQTFQ